MRGSATRDVPGPNAEIDTTPTDYYPPFVPTGTRARALPRFAVAAVSAALCVLLGVSCRGLFGPRYGKTVWVAAADSGADFLTSTAISSSPALGPDGTIYIGATTSWWWPFPPMAGEDGFVLALTANGVRKWRAGTSSGVGALAVAEDGTIYAVAGKELRAISPGGESLWTFAVDSGTIYPPALGADGAIYVAAEDSGLYTLNPDGTVRCRRQLGALSLGAPVIHDGGLVSVPCYGKIVTVDQTGALQWVYATSRWSTRIIAVGGSGRLYVADNDSVLYALGPHGNEEWHLGLSDLASPGVVDQSGNCVFGLAEDDTVICVSPQGVVLWKAVTEWPVRRASAAGTDSAFYLGCMEHARCLGPGGRERWNARLQDATGTPAIRPDGLLLIPDGGALRALTTACDGPAASPWPSSRHDIRNTGRSD